MQQMYRSTGDFARPNQSFF